jgi:uridine phosphorylase
MRQYHLETRPGDIAPRCLLVGAPERARMIARKFFRGARKVGDHRGLKSYTGSYKGVPVSVVTTGMGGASTAIVLPEAVRSGARAFVHAGSCGGLWPSMEIGDLVVVKGALRFDGASDNWAPPDFPAVPHPGLHAELIAAVIRARATWHHGIGATASDFYEGQARETEWGPAPPWILERHRRLIEDGVLFYGMEDATIFVWCATHGRIPCASVNTVYANRTVSDAPRPASDEPAALAALDAIAAFRIPG